jgi:N-acetylglucosaminyl-diphospho-decaprenol L-rhamnosyltransferase
MLLRPVGADVTVIVVTYNSAHVISDLLASLPAALDGLSADIVIVDNGSTDGTADLVAARGGCTVVRSTNVGYAGGINRGVREGSGKGPLLILNPDLRLEPGAVRAMMETLDVPGTGIVAPKVRDGAGNLSFSLRREPSLPRALGLTFTRLPALSEYYNRPEDYEHTRTIDWALGAVLLLARRCFDGLGGWDESFFLYSEETDFCLRARQAGWLTRYEPSAVAVHIGKQSGYNTKTHTMQIVNRVRLYRRRHGTVASFGYFTLALISEGYRAVLGVEQSRHAVVALLVPSRRPPELNCSTSFLPR